MTVVHNSRYLSLRNSHKESWELGVKYADICVKAALTHMCPEINARRHCCSVCVKTALTHISARILPFYSHFPRFPGTGSKIRRDMCVRAVLTRILKPSFRASILRLTDTYARQNGTNAYLCVFYSQFP